MLTPIQQLKLALFTNGMVVTPEARRQISGEQSRPLTLADYASTSGISMELEGHVWVNAPIQDFNANFVAVPQQRLEAEDGDFWVRSGDLRVRAWPVPVPTYHDEVNAWGEPYTSLAITHTDRVRISPVQGCAIACQFCDLPYRHRYRKNSIEALVDSVGRAAKDPLCPARHVLISGGTPAEEDYGYLNEVYAAVTAAHPDMAVDVMMVPMPGLLHLETLKKVGINGLSINLEMFGEDGSRRIMPVKAKLGKSYWFDFFARAVDVFGRGKVRSLILVGLEPLEETLRGVEALASVGCDPVLSPFRPDPHTPLRRLKPPTVELLIQAYERSLEIVDKYGVKLGPRCIPCQHNTVTFPDESGEYLCH
jgi:hypothetical protein